MASSYITRTGDGKYKVIFETDSRKHYNAVQDLCREIIDHKKPDEPIHVVRCRDCAKWDKSTMEHYDDILFGSGDTAECRMFCDMDSWGEFTDEMRRTDGNWFCADGEKKGEDDAIYPLPD